MTDPKHEPVAANPLLSTRFKLSFNTVGNCTTFRRDQAEELEGQWVWLIDACDGINNPLYPASTVEALTDQLDAIKEEMAALLSRVERLENALRLAKDHSELEDEILDIVDAALTPSVADPAEAVQPVGGAVVKPLEWNKYKSLVGYKLCASDPFGNEAGRIDLHPDVTEADILRMKAEAQASYERRILSALSLPQAAIETETAGTAPAPQADEVAMEDEDRTPVPAGFNAAQWRKADEVHHAMALVASDTECVKILYAALAATEVSADASA